MNKAACKSNRRAPNFSQKEEQLLIDLVVAHKDVIENKKTGNINWKKKDETWTKIANLFNCNAEGQRRDEQTLKEKYKNLKKRTKKRNTEYKKEIKKTGGGTIQSPNLDTIDEKIKDLLGVQVDGMSNAYDNDAEIEINNDGLFDVEPNTEGENVTTEITVEEVESITSEPEYEPAQERSQSELQMTPLSHQGPREIVWSSHCSKDLKQQVNPKLKLKTKNTTAHTKKTVQTKKFYPKEQNLIEEKLKFVQRQTECLNIEHNLKVRLIKRQMRSADFPLRMSNRLLFWTRP